MSDQEFNVRKEPYTRGNRKNKIHFNIFAIEL